MSANADIIIDHDHDLDYEGNVFCGLVNSRFYETLKINEEYFKHGILVYSNGDLIGCIKFKGENTFLAFVSNKRKISNLQEYRIYQIPYNIILGFIRNIFHENGQDWYKVNFIGRFYVKASDCEIEGRFRRKIRNAVNDVYEYNRYSKDFDYVVNMEDALINNKASWWWKVD